MPGEKHIHFMGAGGIGVSALAAMALESGCRVSGCDRYAGDITAGLEKAGMEFRRGHDPEHMTGVDLLVYSSAIPENHPERLAAGGRQVSRGGFLAEMMARRVAWGISGTHGKTTTSWLVAHLAISAGLDPTVFIGGIVPDLGGRNYRLGSGPFIAELDESDASFLLPRLDAAIITNIESDHLGHYRDEARLFEAFDRFAAGVADSGLLIAGVDDPRARALFAAHRGVKLSFGLADDADVGADDVRADGAASAFTLRFRKESLGRFTLPLPGRHNILNALAALAAVLNKGISINLLRNALARVRGVERRLERLGEVAGAVLYSDYAHHPTEVAAAIEALRQRHKGRVLVVFQPHLYTRTRDYADGFGRALANADMAVLVDIYPAREEPIPGVTSALIVEAARGPGAVFLGPIALDAVAGEVARNAGNFEAVVLMGAGDIDDVAREMARNG